MQVGREKRPRRDGGGTDASSVPWQLRMFSKSLKKRQKLRLLLRQIGDVGGRSCLLVTNGDNNGALNHHFRAHGGRWTWIENEADSIPEMAALLGEPVLPGRPERIPAADASFDVVVSIDVHEHLADCAPFNRELARVVRPGGIVLVTTPNGDEWKPATVLKKLLGMTKEVYGHTVYGYNVAQHSSMLAGVGLEVVGWGSYSGFVTEMIELTINLAYVKVLSRKKNRPAPREGTIAPTTSEQLRAVEKQYRVWSLAYPLFAALAGLDRLTPFFTGYAVSVVGRRPE